MGLNTRHVCSVCCVLERESAEAERLDGVVVWSGRIAVQQVGCFRELRNGLETYLIFKTNTIISFQRERRNEFRIPKRQIFMPEAHLQFYGIFLRGTKRARFESIGMLRIPESILIGNGNRIVSRGNFKNL